MINFTVSLFGHREIGDLRQLENKLFPIVKNLIRENSYVTFLLGRNGEFDEYAASVIKRAQSDVGKEKSVGGAYKAMKYAKTLNKKVINLKDGVLAS